MSHHTRHADPGLNTGLQSIAYLEKWRKSIPAIMFLYYPHSKKVSLLNERLRDILGYTLEEFRILDYGLADLVYPDDAAVVDQAIQNVQCLREEDSYTFTARFNHKEGGCKYLKNICCVADDAILIVSEDVTEQVRFEEEAIAAQQLFQETEKLLLFGSWSWSLKTDRFEWTEGMLQLLDYKEVNHDAFNIQFFLKHVLSDQSESLNAVFAEAIELKQSFETEFVLKTRNGREKLVFMKGKPVLDKDGNVRKLVGILHDITTKKNFETERERNIRELNRSNKELEEFAYVASHDLHEPLRKILTFSERLKDKFGSAVGQDGKLYLDRITASAGSMRNLIDNLLEFSRISRGARSLVPCDLNDVVKEVLSDQELRIEETSTVFKIRDLPVVEGVPLELKQLFNNLIGNALKFRRKDVPPLVNIEGHKLSPKEKTHLLLPFNRVFYQINVTDNGIGFDPVYAERIFEIFQRLHGKVEYSGSGIGLAICKKIVDNHDGIIYACSEPGQGSTFSVILPEKQ